MDTLKLCTQIVTKTGFFYSYLQLIVFRYTLVQIQTHSHHFRNSHKTRHKGTMFSESKIPK